MAGSIMDGLIYFTQEKLEAGIHIICVEERLYVVKSEGKSDTNFEVQFKFKLIIFDMCLYNNHVVLATIFSTTGHLMLL